MKNIHEEYYDKYCIKYFEKKVLYKDYFVQDKIIVGIGFGMGDATIEIAEQNRDKAYIVINVHKPGIAKILRKISERKFENIRVIEHDADEVFKSMMPNDSLDGIHIFFP